LLVTVAATLILTPYLHRYSIPQKIPMEIGIG
jgi:hypothetical protein